MVAAHLELLCGGVVVRQVGLVELVIGAIHNEKMAVGSTALIAGLTLNPTACGQRERGRNGEVTVLQT